MTENWRSITVKAPDASISNKSINEIQLSFIDTDKFAHTDYLSMVLKFVTFDLETQEDTRIQNHHLVETFIHALTYFAEAAGRLHVKHQQSTITCNNQGVCWTEMEISNDCDQQSTSSFLPHELWPSHLLSIKLSRDAELTQLYLGITFHRCLCDYDGIKRLLIVWSKIFTSNNLAVGPGLRTELINCERKFVQRYYTLERGSELDHCQPLDIDYQNQSIIDQKSVTSQRMTVDKSNIDHLRLEILKHQQMELSHVGVLMAWLWYTTARATIWDLLDRAPTDFDPDTSMLTLGVSHSLRSHMPVQTQKIYFGQATVFTECSIPVVDMLTEHGLTNSARNIARILTNTTNTTLPVKLKPYAFCNDLGLCIMDLTDFSLMDQGDVLTFGNSIRLQTSTFHTNNSDRLVVISKQQEQQQTQTNINNDCSSYDILVNLRKSVMQKYILDPLVLQYANITHR